VRTFPSTRHNIGYRCAPRNGLGEEPVIETGTILSYATEYIAATGAAFILFLPVIVLLVVLLIAGDVLRLLLLPFIALFNNLRRRQEPNLDPSWLWTGNANHPRYYRFRPHATGPPSERYATSGRLLGCEASLRGSGADSRGPPAWQPAASDSGFSRRGVG